jgi:hypothetical protein
MHACMEGGRHGCCGKEVVGGRLLEGVGWIPPVLVVGLAPYGPYAAPRIRRGRSLHQTSCRDSRPNVAGGGGGRKGTTLTMTTPRVSPASLRPVTAVASPSSWYRQAKKPVEDLEQKTQGIRLQAVAKKPAEDLEQKRKTYACMHADLKNVQRYCGARFQEADSTTLQDLCSASTDPKVYQPKWL